MQKLTKDLSSYSVDKEKSLHVKELKVAKLEHFPPWIPWTRAALITQVIKLQTSAVLRREYYTG